MTTKCLILALVAAALGVASPPVLAQGVKPCALLKNAEVQAVMGAQIGEGVAGFLAPTATYTCDYRWTPGRFGPSVQVMVSDASTLLPEMDAGTIKSGILGGLRGLPKDTTVVPGVGEAANYRVNSPTASSAMTYLKGRILEVVYQGSDAPVKKDQVIGLLKAAASRL